VLSNVFSEGARGLLGLVWMLLLKEDGLCALPRSDNYWLPILPCLYFLSTTTLGETV